MYFILSFTRIEHVSFMYLLWFCLNCYFMQPSCKSCVWSKKVAFWSKRSFWISHGHPHVLGISTWMCTTSRGVFREFPHTKVIHRYSLLTHPYAKSCAMYSEIFQMPKAHIANQTLMYLVIWVNTSWYRPRTWVCVIS